ncbi:Peroxiredoxin-1 [Coemansia sp. 'formosensis']|nr:Peroxiredoxin-1 [Coemansia sp. 'formosensis']
MPTSKRVADSVTTSVALAKRLKVTTIIDGAEDMVTDAEAADTRVTAEPTNTSDRCVVGRPAPMFSVPAVLADGTISTLALSQFAGKYLVLLFYPADFTFVCPTEITSFSDHAAEFAAMDCAVAVCSTDSEFVHYNWRQQTRKDGGIGEVAVPMLADRTRGMSRSYGVLCEEEGMAFRGLFIIDTKQVVRVAQINDMPVGRSVDETLRLVSALKFADEHGQVCPANWRKGDTAIDPDIERSKAYFQQS